MTPSTDSVANGIFGQLRRLKDESSLLTICVSHLGILPHILTEGGS